MIILLTVRRNYHFEVEVSAEIADKAVRYKAELAEAAMISHFDSHAEYAGASIEECVEKLANGLAEALDILHAT